MKKIMLAYGILICTFLFICKPLYASENSSVEWDEERKGDTIYIWQANEWEKWQDRLLLSGFLPASAHARVNSKIRSLEGTVKEVLNDESTYGYGQDHGLQHPSEYTEIVLAMIQVLADDTGLFNDGGCIQKEFDEWTKTMGQYVSNSHRGSEWTLKESIYQIFCKFSASGEMLAERYEANGKVDSAVFPSPFEVIDQLRAVV